LCWPWVHNMCVYMCLYMCVCVRVQHGQIALALYIYRCVYWCVYLVCICMFACVCATNHAGPMYINVCRCMNACMRACMWVHMCAYMCIYVCTPWPDCAGPLYFMRRVQNRRVWTPHGTHTHTHTHADLINDIYTDKTQKRWTRT